MNYDRIIREWDQSKGSATDLLVKIFTDLGTRLASVEDATAGTARLQDQLRQYGEDLVQITVNPIRDALIAAADLGAVFTATSTTPVFVGTGEKVFQIPADQQVAFAPPAMLSIVASDNPSIVMWGRKRSYQSLTGVLVVDVLSANGTGLVSSWTITAGTLAAISGQVSVAPVGSLSSTNLQAALAEIDSDLATKAPTDSPAFTGTPTVPTATAGTSTAQAASTAFVAAALAALINAAPAQLDTLNEIATALGNDASFAASMTTALGNRLRLDSGQSFTLAQQMQGRANLGSVGNLLRVTRITGSTTFVPGTDTKALFIFGCGAGGGGGCGGGDAATNAGGTAGGGASGSWGELYTTTVLSSYSVTIGAGGAGSTSTGAAGTSGGASSFGSLMTLNGGGGGGSRAGGSATVVTDGGNPAAATVTGGLAVRGDPGDYGRTISTGLQIPGRGASGRFGSGGVVAVSNGTGAASNGGAGVGYGSGGGGGRGASGAATNGNGGAGAPGYFEVWEFG